MCFLSDDEKEMPVKGRFSWHDTIRAVLEQNKKKDDMCIKKLKKRVSIKFEITYLRRKLTLLSLWSV